MNNNKLRIDFINGLPQPIYLRMWGDNIWWPMESIDVQTGLLRIDVCGKLQVSDIGEVAKFKDSNDKEYETALFYIDYEESEL